MEKIIWTQCPLFPEHSTASHSCSTQIVPIISSVNMLKRTDRFKEDRTDKTRHKKRHQQTTVHIYSLSLLIKPSSFIFLPSFNCVFVASCRHLSPNVSSSQRGWCSKKRHWARSITCWPKTCRGTRQRRRGWPVLHRRYSNNPTGTKLSRTKCLE